MTLARPVTPFDGEPLPLEATLASLARLLRRRAWLVVLLIGATTAALVVPVLIEPRHYAANASFVLVGNRSEAGGLSAVAQQFGIAVPNGNPSRSAEFYADLISSRAILQQVTRQQLPPDLSARLKARSLADVYGREKRAATARVAVGMAEVRRQLSVRMESRTGVVALSVAAPDSQLAEWTAGQLLAGLNSFNLTIRQSQAAVERQFVQQRAAEAAGDLRAAENQLQDFLASNRRFGESGGLAFTRDRLERAVQERRVLLEGLTRSLEQARIEEVRDTPVLTVIDSPEGSAQLVGRGLASRVLLGLVLGTLLGLLAVALLDWRAGLRAIQQPRRG